MKPLNNVAEFPSMIFMWIGKSLKFNWNETSSYFLLLYDCSYSTRKKRIFFPGWLILSKYTSDSFFPIYCVVFSKGYIAFWLSPGSTRFMACTQRPFTSCCCFGREKWQPKGHFSSPATTLKELNYSAFPKWMKDNSSHQRVWTQLF